MAKVSVSILRALRRWEEKGLLDRDKVRVLRNEVEAEVQGENRRWSQYLLAATGGAVLIVAGGTFLAWAWPEMGPAGQSVTLAVIGFLVAGLGVRLPSTSRWAPVAYLLQLAGAILILMALVHSEGAWADGSPGGWAVGVFALLIPPVMVWLAIRQNGILAGLQATLAFFFIFVFLDRALGLDAEAVMWVLDGVMVLALGGLAWKLRKPGVPDWALTVFLSLLFSSVVLVVLTGEFIWELNDNVIFPMDFWLFVVAGLSLWGLQDSAPKHLRRDWYEHQLALCILVAIPFAFITNLETLETGPTTAALTVGVVGGLGLWYSLPRGARSILVASCIALLISAWYWGARMNGALGAVAALVVVSALLFWGASRLGRLSLDEPKEETRRPLAENLGELLPHLRTRPPGPLSLEMAQRLSKVESRNVTHLSADFPVFWEEAKGANVQDVDGNIYLDLTGAFGVSSAGHTPPRVVDGIRDQAGRLIHGMGDVHPPSIKVEFLEALAKLGPWPESRAVLGTSGTEAVEIALKTALLATGRPGILAFDGAYHGLTLGSLATTHREDFRGPFLSRLYKGVRFAPFPDIWDGEKAIQKSLDKLRFYLREGDGGDEVGAVIVEPIQGRAGVRIPPPGYLEALADLTWNAKALLIFDEIFTGLGRTGALFAFLHEGVVPDLLCLGKGLGGGLPLSACVGPSRIMNAWPPSRGEAIHTSTFLGNPLACAAGLSFLEEMAAGDLVTRSKELGETLLTDLTDVLSPLPGVADVRGRGLLLGIDLRDPETRRPLKGKAVRAAMLALQEGLLVLPAGAAGHVLELSPPLVVTEEQLDWAVTCLEKVVRMALAE